MNPHQKWLEEPYQLEQDEKDKMIPIKSGLGVEYISIKEAESEIIFNKKRIKELTDLLQHTDESEEPSILSQIQELEDSNEMLEKAIEGEFDPNDFGVYGETLKSTLDPKSNQYDPDFARIYKRQQKELAKIRKEADKVKPQKESDEIEIEEAEGEDPIDLSKGKIITLKKTNFAEDEASSKYGYQPSERYNPLTEGFIDVKDPKTGKKWASKDVSYLLSDISSTYISAINESIKSGERDKAQKIAHFLKKYLEKEGFPYAVALKRFPVIHEAYYMFDESKTPNKKAGRTMDYVKEKHRVNFLLNKVNEHLKAKNLSKEKKASLEKAKKDLESVVKNLEDRWLEFAEDCYAELPKRFLDKSKNEQSHIKNNLNGLKMALETWLSDESLSEIKKAMDSVDEMGVTPIELARHIPETKHLFKLKHGYFAEFAEKGNKSPSARLKAKLSKEQLKDLNVRLHMLEDAITRWRKDKGINRLLQDLLTSGLKSNEISSLVPNAKGYLEINKIA